MTNEAFIEIGTFSFDTGGVFPFFSFVGPLRFLLCRFCQPLDIALELLILLLLISSLLVVGGLLSLVVALVNGDVGTINR